MEKRLKKIDEFLDSLENTGLSKSQTSLILTAQNGDTSAGENQKNCKNSSPDGCSENELTCKNAGYNCAGASNTDGCENVTLDAFTVCSPTNYCPIISNRADICPM